MLPVARRSLWVFGKFCSHQSPVQVINTNKCSFSNYNKNPRSSWHTLEAPSTSSQFSGVHEFEGNDSLFLHLLQKKDYKGVQDLYENLCRQGAHPTPRSRYLLYQSFMFNNDLQGAMKYFQLERRRRKVLSAELFEPLLSALALGGQLPEAEKLLNEMIQNRINFTGNAYSLMLRGHVKEGNIKEALDYLEAMKMSGSRTCQHFETSVVAFGREGHSEILLDIFNDLRNRGNLITASLYTCLFDSYIVKSNFEKAFEVIDTMAKENVLMDEKTIYYIFKSLYRNRLQDKYDEVLQIASEVNCAVDWRVYNLMIASWLEAGNVDKAVTILEDMKKLNKERKISTYTLFVQHFLRRSNPLEAYKWVTNMREDSLRAPDRFRWNIRSEFLRLGMTDQAKLVEKEAPWVAFNKE